MNQSQNQNQNHTDVSLGGPVFGSPPPPARVSNKKENYAQIYIDGEGWTYRDKKTTISDMSDRAYDILNNHYQVGNNTYMDTFKEQYEERSKSLYKRVHKDTEMMILSNQKQLNQTT